MKESFQSGRFRVQAVIAVGSQGTVYKAVCEKVGFENIAVGTVVVLTTMSVADHDGERFLRLQKRTAELRALTHPGIMRYFGCFLESSPFGDLHVLVTEWLEGETLKDRLHRNPQGLDADEVVRIGNRVLSALTYVSTRGIVHRDIKPSNIFLCKDDTVKLIDFELSCETSRDGGVGWSGCREFPYLAPDYLDPTFRGDEQSDVFGLGVCLHEMLTGRLPYRQQQDGFIFSFMDRWRRGDEDIQMDKRIDRVLQGATEVLAKALTSKREGRYATFADFAAAFKGVRYRELTHGGSTWRLLQYVGRGGFGEVFKACDVKTGQIVAIKHFLKSQYADRFKREARVLSQLKDSSIVRFISFFEKEMDGCGKCAFLVMEYLDGMPGKTLRDELRVAGGMPLPRDLVIPAFARYAHGLSVLHSKGVVHCDIRPVNLYFPTDAIDRAVIMDFGVILKDAGTGGPSRPLDYLPPEVVTKDYWCPTPGMDICALGLCLYEALSGKTAYHRLPPSLADGSNGAGVRMFLERSMIRTPPTLDESSYSDLPDLVRLVREMTEPDVTKRLKDAAEVERRLRALAGKVLVQHDDPCPVYGCPKCRGVMMLLGELWDDVKACMRIKREESCNG